MFAFTDVSSDCPSSAAEKPNHAGLVQDFFADGGAEALPQMPLRYVSLRRPPIVFVAIIGMSR